MGSALSEAFGPFSFWQLLLLLQSLPSFDSQPFSVAFRHSVRRNKKVGEEGVKSKFSSIMYIIIGL